MKVFINRVLIAGILYLLITCAYGILKDAEIVIKYNVKPQNVYVAKEGSWTDWAKDIGKVCKTIFL